MKLAIVTSHPIQYNAPLFAMLHQRGIIEIKVFYTWSQTEAGNKFDPDFGKHIDWDIPLLEGYPYTFVTNISSQPGSHHYKGIINPTLINEIEKWGAQAVLIYGWSFHSHLQAIRYFHNKIKVIFRGDSTLLDQRPGLKNVLKTIYLKWLYTHIDVALYTGIENKLYYKKFGVKDDKLLFAPHAIDNKRFSSINNQSLKDWRRLLGIKPDDIAILFGGKLEPKKNPGLLVKAYKKLVENYSDVNKPDRSIHLIIAGNGLLEAELKNSFQNDKIHFVGFQNQSIMPSLYFACNIFVLPSAGPGETWGLAVNEAMACAKPIIVSDKCGCAVDLVHEHINGSVFKSGDIDDLVNTFKSCLNADIDLTKMGSESLKIIRNWNYEAICEPLEKLVKFK